MTGVALDALETSDRLNRNEPSWRREDRMAAIDWLASHQMPTRRDESWRYTPAEELVDLLGVTVQRETAVALDAEEVDRMAGSHGGSRLVFVNGVFAPGASSVHDEAGVAVRALSELDRNVAPRPVLETDRLDGFAALNSVAGDDSADVTISADAEAAAPIHIVHVAAPEPDTTVIAHPRVLVRIEPGARATIIESYVGLPGAALTNAATVIDVDDRAALAYHRVQTEAPTASHIGHVRIRVGQNATVSSTSFNLGGRISRVAFDVSLVGDHSHFDIDGLYNPAGDERHDNVITAEHTASHTVSDQRFRGVVDDRARGSFTGQVIVHHGAVDTVAEQLNHSLLLTRKAESDTRPWLEILADDVRCTHGATIGRLDDEALFYLRTRGLTEADARSLLIEGFTSEVIESVAVESLRDHLSAVLLAKQRRPEEQR